MADTTINIKLAIPSEFNRDPTNKAIRYEEFAVPLSFSGEVRQRLFVVTSHNTPHLKELLERICAFGIDVRQGWHLCYAGSVLYRQLLLGHYGLQDSYACRRSEPIELTLRSHRSYKFITWAQLSTVNFAVTSDCYRLIIAMCDARGAAMPGATARVVAGREFLPNALTSDERGIIDIRTDETFQCDYLVWQYGADRWGVYRVGYELYREQMMAERSQRETRQVIAVAQSDR